MSFELNLVRTDNAPHAVGAYSQGVEHNGVYYFSGQIGIDPKTSQLKETFNDQLSQIMKNIDGLLGAVGIDKTHILKTSVFMTDLSKFDKVNEAYLEYFGHPFPARSCVQVSALPKGAVIEIEVIAAK